MEDQGIDIIRTIVVDDHAMFRSGLISVLERQPHVEVVGSFGDGASAIDFLQEHDVDIVLLDINLPGKIGTVVAKEMWAVKPKLKILFVTMLAKSQTLGSATLDDRVGYITKDADPTELVKEMNALVAGNQKGQSDGGTPKSAGSQANDQNDQLSDREREVLELYRSGVGTAAIARQLDIGKSTVSTHLKNIREKLGIQSLDAIRRQ